MTVLQAEEADFRSEALNLVKSRHVVRGEQGWEGRKYSLQETGSKATVTQTKRQLKSTSSSQKGLKSRGNFHTCFQSSSQKGLKSRGKFPYMFSEVWDK